MSNAERLGDDIDGLGGLYRRYGAWLVRRLTAQVSAEDAADIAQETYLRVAPLASGSIRYPKALLLKVATNLVHNQRRRLGMALAIDAEQSRFQVDLASQQHQVLLKQVIVAMPPLYRDVFILSRFEGMSYVDIASLKGLSVQAVQWRMTKALDYCAARLGE